MACVPGFSNDIFISYSHIDDQAVKGSVAGSLPFIAVSKLKLESIKSSLDILVIDHAELPTAN